MASRTCLDSATPAVEAEPVEKDCSVLSPHAGYLIFFDATTTRKRILSDLLKGKTWLVRDGENTAATITIDADEPLDAEERCVWPTEESQQPALYMRLVIVSRRYAGLGLGAALMDWAADMAQRDHRADLIRIDVRTTNVKLHAYYEGQCFIRCPDPQGLGDYPSQALFERSVDVPGSDFTKFVHNRRGSWSSGYRAMSPSALRYLDSNLPMPCTAVLIFSDGKTRPDYARTFVLGIDRRRG